MSAFNNILKAKKLLKEKVKKPSSKDHVVEQPTVASEDLKKDETAAVSTNLWTISPSHPELPTFQQAIRGFSSLYTSVSLTLAAEYSLMNTLVYRYKRQQRHADFYQALALVTRRLRHLYKQMLLLAAMHDDLTAPASMLSQLLASSDTRPAIPTTMSKAIPKIGKPSKEVPGRNIKSGDLSVSIIDSLPSLATYISHADVHNDIIHAAHSLQHMLAQVVLTLPKFTSQIRMTYFLPLCVTGYAALVRVYVVARTLLKAIMPLWRSASVLFAPVLQLEAVAANAPDKGTITGVRTEHTIGDVIERVLRLKLDVKYLYGMQKTVLSSSLVLPLSTSAATVSPTQSVSAASTAETNLVLEAFLSPLHAPASPALITIVWGPQAGRAAAAPSVGISNATALTQDVAPTDFTSTVVPLPVSSSSSSSLSSSFSSPLSSADTIADSTAYAAFGLVSAAPNPLLASFHREHVALHSARVARTIAMCPETDDADAQTSISSNAEQSSAREVLSRGGLLVAEESTDSEGEEPKPKFRAAATTAVGMTSLGRGAASIAVRNEKGEEEKAKKRTNQNGDGMTDDTAVLPAVSVSTPATATCVTAAAASSGEPLKKKKQRSSLDDIFAPVTTGASNVYATPTEHTGDKTLPPPKKLKMAQTTGATAGTLDAFSVIANSANQSTASLSITQAKVPVTVRESEALVSAATRVGVKTTKEKKSKKKASDVLDDIFGGF